MYPCMMYVHAYLSIAWIDYIIVSQIQELDNGKVLLRLAHLYEVVSSFLFWLLCPVSLHCLHDFFIVFETQWYICLAKYMSAFPILGLFEIGFTSPSSVIFICLFYLHVWSYSKLGIWNLLPTYNERFFISVMIGFVSIIVNPFSCTRC